MFVGSGGVGVTSGSEVDVGGGQQWRRGESNSMVAEKIESFLMKKVIVEGRCQVDNFEHESLRGEIGGAKPDERL